MSRLGCLQVRGGMSHSAPSLPESRPRDTITPRNVDLDSHLKPFACVIRGCPSMFCAEGEAVPHRLSCGDVVCSGCWSAIRVVGTCAICGMVGVTAEFVDVALAKLAKTLMGAAPAAVPPPPCFDCTLLGDGGIVATHVCDCAGDKPLCGDHVIVHTRRGHDPFPLLPSAAPELSFCETHPNERIKLFCVEDRQAICTVCGPVSHSGHTIVDLGSAPALLEPQLSAAVDSLASQCSIAADRIVAVLNERDAVRVAADTSEAAAEAAFAALQSAIESHKSRSLRSLLTLRDTREKALTTQSTVLQHGLSQMRDGVALGRHALQSREPSTMTSTLRSLGALARIPTRKYSGPCESRVLSLDVDTSALLDALPLCSTLRQSPDAQELAVKTVSMLDAENEHLVNMISEAEAKCEQLDKLMKRQLAAFEVEKAKLLSASSSHSTTSSNIQAAFAAMLPGAEKEALALCTRISAAGKAGPLPQSDVNVLLGLGAGAVSNPAVSSAVCEAFSGIASRAENRALLGGAAVKAVLSIMDAHASNPGLQSNGSQAIWNLTASCPDNKSAAFAAGALPRIKRAWRVIKVDRRHHAVGAIASMMSPGSVQAILDDGWLDRVLRCMAEPSTSADVSLLRMCCATLSKFVDHDLSRAAMLADARCLAYLTHARDSHPDHADIQSYAQHALSSLVPAISECHRISAVGKAGVLPPEDVEAMVRVGKTCVNDAGLGKLYCRTLAEVSWSGDEADRRNALLLGLPAVREVLAVMDAHPTDPSLQAGACAALWNMTFLAEANKPLSVSAGAISRVDRAWSVLRDIPDVTRASRAIAAIGSLITSDSVYTVLGSGWIDATLQFMDKHRLDEHVQYPCCAFMWQLGCQPAGKAALLTDVRTVPYLKRVRDAYPVSVKIQRYSKLALSVLGSTTTG